jgi:hypothetical protein
MKPVPKSMWSDEREHPILSIVVGILIVLGTVLVSHAFARGWLSW